MRKKTAINTDPQINEFFFFPSREKNLISKVIISVREKGVAEFFFPQTSSAAEEREEKKTGRDND